jgi:hypothetical protein
VKRDNDGCEGIFVGGSALSPLNWLWRDGGRADVDRVSTVCIRVMIT